MKRIILIVLSLFFVQSCNRKEEAEVQISVANRQQLNNHCLQIKLIIKNNTKENYLIPIGPKFYLDNEKILYSVPSQIITSDISKTNDKRDFVLQEFTEKNIYKYLARNVYKMMISQNYEEYSNYLFFIPKNSNKELYLVFNNYQYCNEMDNCNEIFSHKSTKIRVDSYTKKDIDYIDSLIKINKLDFTIYKKQPYLEDSLFVNR
ncbi:hypothetical protein [Halpernia sp. GG3]